MTDYIACGKVVPERIAAIVKGIAEACAEAGCALLGGETAEHPGLLGPTSTTSPARPPGWWSATASSGADRVAAGRRRRRDGVLGPALQRLLPGPPRAAPRRAGRCDRARRRARAARSARSCSPRPAIYAARLPGADRRRRGARDEPRHRRRAGRTTWPASCRPRCTVTVDRATWPPAPVFGLVRDLGRRQRSPTSRPRSTWASAWSPCCPRTAVERGLELLAAPRAARLGVRIGGRRGASPASRACELVGSYA